MTARDRARLAAILGMLGSEFEGEQASAARQAEAFRKRHGLTWEQMLALPPLQPEPPPRDAAKEAAEAKARAEAEAGAREAAREAQAVWLRAKKAAREADEGRTKTAPSPPPTPSWTTWMSDRWWSSNLPEQTKALFYVGGVIGGVVLIEIYL